MTVAVRGRVPRDPKGQFTEKIATHIQERLQALERAAAGGGAQFTSPTTPTFGGGGPIVAPGGGGGGGGGGGPTITDHGMLVGLLDNDHPQYLQEMSETHPLPHMHDVSSVSGIERNFVQRGERLVPHGHNVGDITDLAWNDSQAVLSSRIFGRR